MEENQERAIVDQVYVRTVVYEREGDMHSYQNRVLCVKESSSFLTMTLLDDMHKDEMYEMAWESFDSGVLTFSTHCRNFPVGVRQYIRRPAHFITYKPEKEEEITPVAH